MTSIIYSICLQNVLLRVKYPEKQTLTVKCIRGILSSPYFFTLNSDHLVLKKHLLANIRTIECRNLAAQHDARKKYIQSSTEKKCQNLQVDFVVSKLFRSTSHLNNVYLRKKRSFSACHVSIMSYYVVTGLQLTLTGIPSSWKVIFRLDFHIIPYLRYCFFSVIEFLHIFTFIAFS